MLKKFWNDEAGAIISAELAIVLTIVVIGMVTGLSSLRDAVITELADVGSAIASLDQSYTVSGATSHSASTSNSGFADTTDFCDGTTGTAVTNERCLVIGLVPQTGLTQADGPN